MLLSLVVSLLLLLIISAVGFAIYQSLFNRFIQVSGRGVVKQKPTEASVVIGLRTDNIPDTEISTALDSNFLLFSHIVEKTRKLIPSADIETRTYTISPNNVNVADNMYSIYNSATIQIRGELGVLPNVIRNAVKNGSNSISNIVYTIDEVTLENAKLLSQELALKDARKNAQNFANQLNEKIGDAQQIIDNPNTQQERTFSVTKDNLNNDILFVPQDIDVVTRITVRYELSLKNTKNV